MKRLTNGIHCVKNIQSTGIHAGLKRNPAKKDLALLYFPAGATVAGVFTRNLVKAWPVQYGQKLLQEHDRFKAILINSGNANACNGLQGKQAMETIIEHAATTCQVKPEEVLVSSTGLIGAPLKTETFVQFLPKLFQTLQSESSEAIAEAILTTDTVKKETAYELEIDGILIKMGAMAKGSGMIHPNMGTMLSYIVTDVACHQALLQQMLQQAVDKSFNSITIDGDTSTNDTVFLCATGDHQIELTEKNISKLQALVTKVCQDLAQMIVKDGEGASKFITIQVKEAANDQEALAVAKAIATSTLFKTAVFGQDPNWGRILSAAGNSGVASLDPNQIDISYTSNFGSVKPCVNGAVTLFDRKLARQILTSDEVTVGVNLHQGQSQATVWTCDLTYEYVEINAEYST